MKLTGIWYGSYLANFASLRNLDHVLIWPIVSTTAKYKDLAFHKRYADRIANIISKFIFECNPYITLDVPAVDVVIRDVWWLITSDYVYNIIENEAARILKFYWRSKFNFYPWIPSICEQFQRIGSVFTYIIQSFVPHMYISFFGRSGNRWLWNELSSLKNKLASITWWLIIYISSTNKPHRSFFCIKRWI